MYTSFLTSPCVVFDSRKTSRMSISQNFSLNNRSTGFKEIIAFNLLISSHTELSIKLLDMPIIECPSSLANISTITLANYLPCIYCFQSFNKRNSCFPVSSAKGSLMASHQFGLSYLLAADFAFRKSGYLK